MRRLLVLLSFFCTTLPTSAAPLCQSVLQISEQNFDIDTKIQELAKLKIRLEQGKASGEGSISLTALKKDYTEKQLFLVQFLEANNLMTLEQFRTRFRQEIFKIQNSVKDNREQEAKTEKDREEQSQLIKEEITTRATHGNKAVFHKITRGSFKMGLKNVDVTLTKDFELMSTVTTQIIWRKVAELANKKTVQKRIFGIAVSLNKKYKLNPEPSTFRGKTLPVEQVQYSDVQEWIKALNELSAEDAPELYQLIVGHKKGAKYRLPTEAEWEFVMRGRGHINTRYFYGFDANLMEQYAWFEENSLMQTHVVAQKLPLIVEGNEFYDMVGNVWQWVQDADTAQLPGGIDPVVTTDKKDSKYVVRGGNYLSNRTALNADYRKSFSATGWNRGVGFRLVRELP